MTDTPGPEQNALGGLPDRAATSTRHAYFERRVREVGALDKDSDYNGLIGQSVLDLSRVFARQGHSGGSASSTVGLFNQLMSEYDAGGKSPATPDPRNTVADAIPEPVTLSVRPEWIRDRVTELAKMLPTGHWLKYNLEVFIADAERAQHVPPVSGLGAVGGSPASPAESDWRRERAARAATTDEQAIRRAMNGLKDQTEKPRSAGRNVLTPEGIRLALESSDAARWAQAFVQIREENPGLVTDEGTMIGWFANAIMRGYDDASARLNAKLDRVRKLELLRTEILATIDAGIDRELL